uniref:tRNA (Cytosine(38)-C(5))-methyltransferase n=1 Tax=Mesocestoides corti TaxID=53468 RepID=A0A5K3FQ38_MESCO
MLLSVSLSINECLLFEADLWTLSPPCQPFTRMGKQKQGMDTRSSSLRTIIDLIRRIKPPAILLENVKGFEGSDAWRSLIETLVCCDYDIRQFLLTPLQFGVPNCRLRYYLVAKLRTEPQRSMFSFGQTPINSTDASTEADSNILRFPIFDVPLLPNCQCIVCTEKARNITSIEDHYAAYVPLCRPIQEFLLPKTDVPEYLFLSKSDKERFYRILDIVSPESHKSACFTKGYGQRFEGTGSFLTLTRVPPADTDATFPPTLRAFHSKEIANLMCFPADFEFPEEVTEKQRKRLLGNSINVLVVAHILNWAFSTN